MRLTGCAGTTVIRTLRPGRGNEVTNMTTNTITHAVRQEIILRVERLDDRDECVVTMEKVVNGKRVDQMSIRVTTFQYNNLFIHEGAGLYYNTVLPQED